MKRLTQTFEENGEKFACLPECKNGCIYGLSRLQSGCRCHNFAKILDRLSALEDILGDDYDIDRLREMVEADKNGRFIVTKCKIGDTMFVVGNKKIIKTKVREICFNDVFELIYLVEFKCDNLCDGCPFHSHSQFWEEEWECEGVYGDVFVKQSDFCKTVFLTQEAAEEALKGEQNG